jgi:hypothetical protein
MFIGQDENRNQPRSKERNGAGVVRRYLTSAPSNGAGGGLASQSINMSHPHGVKPANCSTPHEIAIEHVGVLASIRLAQKTLS